MKDLSLVVKIKVLGVRSYVDGRGNDKTAIDIYVEGAGSSTVITNEVDFEVDDIKGFLLGLYNGRLYLRPVINKKMKGGDH